MLPPPSFLISLFFSLTDGPVVSLPVWFLNSEHEIWRWKALSLQLLQPSLGPMRPQQALRNCCVGTWRLLHWSLAESCYPAEWLWHVREAWGLEVPCACHGLASYLLWDFGKIIWSPPCSIFWWTFGLFLEELRGHQRSQALPQGLRTVWVLAFCVLFTEKTKI